MNKKLIKTLVIWGVIIAIVVTAIVLLVTVVNKKEEAPVYQIEGTTLVQYNGKDVDVVIPKEVKMVGKHAFKNNTNVQTVTFESGSQIEKIAMGAFESCAGLQEITFPSTIKEISDYAFLDCVSLKMLEMPSDLVRIGKSAFDGCANLADIELNEGLEVIDDFALANCPALIQVVLPSSLTTFGSNVLTGSNGIINISFMSPNANYVVENNILYTSDYKELIVSAKTTVAELSINSKVETIKANAFYNAQSVKTLVALKNVKFIESDAFSGCTKLERAALPFIGNELDSSAIFSSVFGKVADSLKEVVILQGTKIYDKAFSGLNYIESIELPTTIRFLGEAAFESCSSLATIIGLPNNLKIIKDNTFSGCTKLSSKIIKNLINSDLEIIGSKAFAKCETLDSIVIPENVRHIGIGAFAGCSKLQSITLPFIGMGYEIVYNKVGDPSTTDTLNTAKLVGYIFSETEITNNQSVLPNSLTTITITGDYDIPEKAFLNCTRLQNINLNNNVKKVGAQAFKGCTALTEFTLPENVESIGAAAFEGANRLTTVHNFPAKITVINDYLFYDCKRLASIAISSDITTIGKYAFFNCAAEITVAAENQNFEIHNGSLYTKGLQTLIRYQAQSKDETSFTVPAQTVVVAEGSFLNATNLETIIVPTTVKEIQQFAIVGCSNITSIELPFIGNVGEEYAEITGIIRNDSFDCIFGGAKPEQLSLTISDGETIGVGAFSNNSYITEITLSDTFKEIEASAFEKCTGLVKVNFGTPENPAKITKIGERAFSNCGNLESITLADTIEEIGSYAFAECSKISEITLPKNLEIIGEGVFMNCTSLKKMNLSADNAHYKVAEEGKALLTKDGKSLVVYAAAKPADVESTEYVLSNEVVNLYSYAFSGSTYLTSITLHDNIESIGDGVFYNSKKLKKVVLNSSIKTINSKMFEDCFALTEVVNISNVNSIEAFAFKNCTKFNNDAIFATLSSIEQYAFEGCTSLTNVVLPDTITSIANGVFKDCSNLSTVKYSDNITIIGDYAFQNCTKLSTYELPSKLETIGRETFRDATQDTKLGEKTIIVMIPETVTSIGNRAFYLARQIDKVYIPATVTSIDEGGMDIGANTSIFTDGVTFTVTKDENDKDVKTYTYPEGWLSFRTIQCSIFAKDEYIMKDGIPTPLHEHTPCEECGLCTDKECDGEESEKCQGHETSEE